MSTLEISLQEILNHVQGQLLNAEASLLSPFETHVYAEIAYDSRKAAKDGIFLCILGEKVDGHDYIPDVVKAGTKLIIGDNAAKLAAHSKKFPKTQFFIVKNSLTALQALATFYRRKFPIPCVGLTGSSGKTTTKDLAASIFKVGKPALITEGTLNNHWGVPQMVMRLRHEHKAAVFEMGMSDFGEIAQLSSICQPDIGYITTIGSAHLEKLKDEHGVLKAKRELFDWILEHGNQRVLIFNLDNPLLEALHEEFLAKKVKSLKIITLTQRKAYADVKLVSKRALGIEHRFGWEYEFSTPWGVLKGRLPLPGAHNLGNAMAAATLSLATGVVNAQDVVEGLDKPMISKLRSNLFKTEQGTVIYDDSYNANPTSVTALFEAARLIRTNNASGLSKTVAVVGDMLELGPNSADLHKKMGKLAAQDGVDILLATGQFASAWVEGFKEAKSTMGAALDFSSQDELTQALKDELQSKPGETLVLIKGSRGAKMDQIVDKLKKPSA